ncbi:MAG: aminotransferase class IV [bacterium]
MVKTITSINGRLVDKVQARISVFDNALLYAEGLFETFLAVDDEPVFAREHLARLYRGARVIGLEIPEPRDTIMRWCRKTLRAHPDRIKKLRLTLTAGESGRWLGRQGRPQIILSAAPHRVPTEPFRLLVSDFRVDHHSEFRQIKTLSYAIHAAALKQAHKMDYDDALLLNQRGNVAEVTSANVFWVENGRIYTPPLEAGCLEGVTRKIVLRQAAQLGLTITGKRCSLARLLQAPEVLISSSLKLVLPVGEIRVGRRRYRFKPGPAAALLSAHFRRQVGID